MSKIVKGIGRAIGAVVSGVVNAVKTFAQSKIGKLIITAVAFYFGVPMLAGAVGGAAAGAAAGTGMFSGAMTGASAGLAGAWSGVTGAATALGDGEFGKALSSLATGSSASGAYAAGQTAVGGAGLVGGTIGTIGAAPAAAGGIGESAAATTAVSPPVTGAPLFVGPPLPTVAPTVVPPVIPPVTPPPTTGLIGSALKQPLVQAELIKAGGSVLQGYGQGKTLEAQQKYQQQILAADRARYNANVGTSIWGAPQAPQAPVVRQY